MEAVVYFFSMDMIRTLRPRQWSKNVLVFILPFSDGKIIGNEFDVQSILKSIVSFIAISMMSSFNYIVNDMSDIKSDRQHATKKNRPIASGKISIWQISFLLISMLLGSISISFYFLSLNAAYFIVGFGFLQFTYTYVFKDILGVDIVVIAALFFLRAVFPYSYLDIYVSPWLTTSILFAALSIISAKRFSEIQQHNNLETRKVLGSYSYSMLLQTTVAFWTLTLYSYVSWLQMQGEKINLTIGIATIFPLTAIFIRILPKLISPNAENPEKYLFEDKINLFLLLIIGIGYLYGKQYL